jgi:hypothetical protein
MTKLARTLYAEGDLDGARALQERALDVRRQVLGDDHPHTLTAMNDLGVTLHAQGNLGGARDLQSARSTATDGWWATCVRTRSRRQGNLSGAAIWRTGKGIGVGVPAGRTSWCIPS